MYNVVITDKITNAANSYLCKIKLTKNPMVQQVKIAISNISSITLITRKLQQESKFNVKIKSLLLQSSRNITQLNQSKEVSKSTQKS